MAALDAERYLAAKGHWNLLSFNLRGIQQIPLEIQLQKKQCLTHCFFV
jgi:hypothetical protein